MESGQSKFILHSEYKPTGDQPEAIKTIVEGVEQGKKLQVILGATGTGKTFTAANIIADYDGILKPVIGWTDIFNQSTNTRLRIESMQLGRLRLQDGKFQTRFSPVASNSTGEYKLKLADRYFIH